MADTDMLEQRIVAALQTAFAVPYSGRPDWTRAVTKTLCDLGHDLGFEVSARGCPEADHTEWLYDMSWSCQSKGGTLLRLPMVLESEWKSAAPAPTIDDDFQKLVQARAEIRVWVFTGADVGAVENYFERCREQAESFSGKQPGDRYVCAGFDWKSKGIFIKAFRV